MTPIRKAKIIEVPPKEEFLYVLYLPCTWMPYKDPQCRPLPAEEYKKFVKFMKEFHPRWWVEYEPFTEVVPNEL